MRKIDTTVDCGVITTTGFSMGWKTPEAVLDAVASWQLSDAERAQCRFVTTVTTVVTEVLP